MPRDGTGTYTLPLPAVATNTPISSTGYNSTTTDIASALTGSVARDGQAAMTGNLPMGGNRITGMGTGVTGTDAATVAQVTPIAQTAAGQTYLGRSAAITANPTYVEFELPAGFQFFEFATNDIGPLVNDAVFLFQLSTNAGATWIAGSSDYIWGAQSFNNIGSGPTAPTTANYALASFPQENSATHGVFSTIRIAMPDTSGRHEYHVNVTNTESTGLRGGLIAGRLSAATTRANRIRFAFNSSNFQNKGLIMQWGLRA